MKLNPNIFEESPVPFELVYGQVGKIYLKIPFWDMFKSPLIIQVENVFGLIKIKPDHKWNENQQKEAY